MDLQLGSALVEELGSEYTISLHLSGGSVIRIETKFKLAQPGRGASVVDPQNLDSGLGTLDALRGRAIVRATADEIRGSLALTFGGGVSLEVEADPDFEAWSVVCRDGSQIISLPGGGLSRWDSTS